MNASASTVVAALNLRYLLDYPGEAARRLELMSAADWPHCWRRSHRTPWFRYGTNSLPTLSRR